MAARKPELGTQEYNKYGFVRVRTMTTSCPQCWARLNAGPNYMPNFCSKCGQEIDWTDIQWAEDEELGFVERT